MGAWRGACVGGALVLCCVAAARAIVGGSETQATLRDVSKCCERGFQLHAVAARCVPRAGGAAVPADADKWELLRPPMGDADAYWLPPALREGPVFASYDALDTAHHADKLPSFRLRTLGYSQRVEAKPETVERFLKVNSTARRFELTAFKGRVGLSTVRRQTFCFDATDSPHMPHVIFTTLELRSVPKCCAKGYQLNAQAEACEQREKREKNENATEEIIDPFVDPKVAYWLPRKMLNTVIVAVYRKQQQLLRWNVAVDANSVVGLNLDDDDDYDDYEDDEAGQPKAAAGGGGDGSKPEWELREDGAGYSVRVRGPSRTGSRVEGVTSEFCFDTTADGPLPHRMMLARLWSLPKCCARAQQLNANATGCEARADARAAAAAGDAGGGGGFEDLSAVVASGAQHWVPVRLRSMQALLVEYLRESDRKWMSARQVIPADNELLWQLDLAGDAPRVMVLAADAANHSVRSRASVYCFDSRGADERVLLTVVSQVNKCCRKDEQLDVRAAKCVDRLGVEDGGSETGIVDAENPEAAFWIPQQLRNNLIPVRYDFGLMEKGGVVFDANHGGRWRIDFNANGSVLSLLSSTTLSGTSRAVSTDRFCFDAIEKDGPVALIADVCYEQGFNCFFKCCPSGKLLSVEGKCTDNSGRDWSPRVSAAAKFLSSEGLYTAKILSNPICGNASFHADRTPASPEEFAARLQGKERQYRFSKTFFCADFREGAGAGAGAGEALAYCVAPPIAPTYEAVRPLGVAAVALLAAALALLLRAPDTRASTHGRALACHAACLLAANATQAAWFFLDRDDAYCKYY
ncbi:Protein of unknown function, partial [Gryllus bimaculatus]